MAQYRVGGQGAEIVHVDGRPYKPYLPPGTVIDGDLEPVADAPKMRRPRSDKAKRAGRDYEAPSVQREDK